MRIHPFADGNGWMSRMILKAILYAFIGCVAPIYGDFQVNGEDESKREEGKEKARQTEYNAYMGC